MPGFEWPACCSTCCCHPPGRHRRALASWPAAAQAVVEPRRNIIASGTERFDFGELPAQPAWQELSPTVCCVLGGNAGPYTLNGTNCYLIGSGRRRIILDAGEKRMGHPQFLQNLDECMRAVGCDGLCGIVVSHMHHDHYGGVPGLLQRYGSDIPVYKSAVAASNFALVEAIAAHGQLGLFFDAEGELLFANAGDRADEQKQVVRSVGWLQDELGLAPEQLRELPWVFGFLWESKLFWDQLESGGIRWVELTDQMTIGTPDGSVELRAVRAPGHSADHFCFMLDTEQALFSGDHVLGYGTSFVGDHAEYMDTLEMLIREQPSVLLPGHGPPARSGATQILERYASHRLERERQVWRLLSSSWPELSARQAADQLYGQMSPGQLRLAAQNCHKVLLGLYKRGRIRMVDEHGPVAALARTSYRSHGSQVMEHVFTRVRANSHDDHDGDETVERPAPPVRAKL